MTFCIKTKLEIASTEYADCCNASFIYGVLSFAKAFSKDRIVVSTANNEVLEFIKNSLLRFGIQNDKLTLSENSRSVSLSIFDNQVTDRLLSDFGYSGDEPNYRILEQNFLCDKCRAAFFAGCFLIGGNITEPSKNYHLEFTTHKYVFLRDFVGLLNSANFYPKDSKRKSLKRIVYFKDSSQIEDFLAYIGAQDAAMNVMNEKIYKDVINRVNRQTNCENANIDKIIRSSEEDRRRIEYIFSTSGKEHLPPELREIAVLRLANPELSLSELGKLTEPPLSKSGVNHRLNRIRSIAVQLKRQKEQ